MLISLLVTGVLLTPQDARDATISLAPRTEAKAVVCQGAEYLMRVRNNRPHEVTGILEAWVSPEVSLRGIPGGMRLKPHEVAEFRFAVHVEECRPAGRARVRIFLRDATGSGRLGEAEVVLHVATGRDFVRLSFEDPGVGVVTGDAPHGRAFLRAAADMHLLGPEDPSFDISTFPYLTFWLRNQGRSDTALNFVVGKRKNEISVPLPAARDWQRIVVDLRKALGDAGPEVSSIDLRGSVDLDEFAVVRSPATTMGDRLRDLTARHRKDLSLAEIATLQRELQEVEANSLSPQELVDYELLRHDLQWQEIQSTLPRKQRRMPAGKERFDAMLHHVHHLDLDSAELRRLGEEQVRLHQRMLEELAGRLAPGKGWREVAELLKRKHPSAEQLPVFARTAMQEALEFTIANSLVTVPHAARYARVQVVTKGPLSRTYPFGGYGGARPSRTGYTGTYFVSPPADWMDPQQSEERLRGNHCAKTRVVALHEVVPGHHLQSVVHRLRPLSPFRRRFYSTVFGEGWALYCEETMYRSGFFDAETRFAQLQMRLWRAVRVVVDVGLHLGQMTMAEAEEMLVQAAGLDPVNAQAEVLRYIDNPTRPMSYLVGYLMIDGFEAAERKRLGNRFDGRVFRDRLLAFGPVPLPAVLKGLRR